MVESIVEITKKKARNGSRKIETECPVSKENGIRRIEKKSMIIIENDTTTQAQISNIVKITDERLISCCIRKGKIL